MGGGSENRTSVCPLIRPGNESGQCAAYCSRRCACCAHYMRRAWRPGAPLLRWLAPHSHSPDRGRRRTGAASFLSSMIPTIAASLRQAHQTGANDAFDIVWLWRIPAGHDFFGGSGYGVCPGLAAPCRWGGPLAIARGVRAVIRFTLSWAKV